MDVLLEGVLNPRIQNSCLYLDVLDNFISMRIVLIIGGGLRCALIEILIVALLVDEK